MNPSQTLIVSFHSLPFEIKEKIQRFTYKTQNQALLQAITDITAAKKLLCKLTRRIDLSFSNDELMQTTENIHQQLWSGLNCIINNPNKNLLIHNWKYKTEFNHTISQHANGNKQFKLLNWEASFTLYFWMCIYH